MSIKNTHIDGDVSYQRNITAGGSLNIQGSARFGHSVIVEGWLEANNIKGANKGLFGSYDTLFNTYPRPENGWFAGVTATAEEITALGLPSVEGQSYFVMYICEADKWEKEPSGKLYRIEVDIAQVNELEDNVNQLRINVDACSSATNQNKEQIQSLQTQVTENAKQIESNKQGVEQAKVDAADAKQTANTLEQEVQTLKTRADSHDTSINNVASRAVTNSDMIRNLDTKINEAQTKVATNQLEISTLNTKVSSKADLSNSEQSISAKKVLVKGGYVIDNGGEEATISYDGGVQDGNSFLKFTDSQNGGLIKLVFDGTEDTIAMKSQFDNRINTISSRVDIIEQDMDYVNEDVPNLKLRCDNLEEDAKIVLASMGTAVDNEGNDSEVSIGYVPSVGDRYYDNSTGHIKWVKSSTITEDLGLPRADRIYCNGMTKRLYVFKNGWKKVGEPNEDLSKIKSDIQLNTNSIETINSVLGTKRNEIEYVKQDTDVLLGTAKNKFIVLATNLSLSLNKTTLGFSEGEFNEVYFLLDDSNKLYISGWDIYSSEDVVLEPGYQYLIHIVNHYMTFTKLNTFITNTDGGVAVK